MKVTPDVTSNQARRVSADGPHNVKGAKNAVNSPQNRAANLELQQGISNRLSMDRSLADALSIAQVSASLVQKAIVVSSRLRNIAAEALASGRIDTAALEETVSQIPADLERFSDVMPGHPRVNMDAGTARTVNVSDILAETAGVAENIRQGNIPGEEIFNRLDDNLVARQRDLGEVAAGLENRIGARGPVFKDVTPNLTGSTVETIIGKPGDALAAQGNVIAENAAALTA